MRLAVFLVLMLQLLVPPRVLAQSNPEVLLLGLFINEHEKDPIDALKITDDYYIPFTIFIDAIAIQPTQNVNGWTFTTPIGVLTLPQSAMSSYQGKTYLNINAAKIMGIPIEFNQSKYAIGIYPPWNKETLSTKKIEQQKTPRIDYYPNNLGLNNITLSGGITQQQNNQHKGNLQKTLQLGVSGHALGGLWGGQFNYADSEYHNSVDKKSSIEVNRLYWATFGEQTALRIGTNSNPSFNTANSSNFSGVAIAYSNQNIDRHLAAFNQFNSSLLQNSSNDYRTISGQGPIGGVAELRLNGRGVARVRIGLDKHYEFTNLNLGQLYDAEYEIEVALYEHNFANEPIEIIPYTLGKRQSNVSTDELLFEAGIGLQGNVFKKKEQNKQKQTYRYAYAEYGLHNNIALRGGISKKKDTAILLGINIGLSPTINWDIAYDKTSTHQNYQSFLSYSGKKIGANYQFQYRKSTTNRTEIDKNHALYVYLRPFDAVNLGINAYHNENIGNNNTAPKNQETYFTANANIHFADNLYGNINRNRYGDMSYRLNWNLPEYRTNLSFSTDKYQHDIALDHQLSPDLRIGANWKHSKHQLGDWYKTYAEYQLSEKSKIFANVSHYRSNNGYQMGWQYSANNGLHISLGYQYNNNLTSHFSTKATEINNNDNRQQDEQHYLYLQFNLSLMHVPGSGYQFGQSYSNNNGRIIATIDRDQDLPIDNKDISLQLDGKSIQATQLSEGNYLIENLKPGIYQVGLDNKDLPIEYSAETLPRFNVKVANAATTVVPYYLEKRFGFSGKIQGINENSQSVIVDIYQGNEKITNVQSNDFGYYQVLGLKAGNYTVKAKGYRDTTVKLTDSFLFEVDLKK